jgi:hypothetical protein
MKYGLICSVCDKLLWKGNVELNAGDLMTGKGWVHGQTGAPAKKDELRVWCCCKGPLKQVELQEPR